MTTKATYLQLDADAGRIVQFPEPPPEEMTGYYSVSWPGYPGSLAEHFGNPDTTIITSEVAAALMLTPDWAGVRYPDLLIAFNVNPAANRARLGYLIPEQGKPPDFVLEVASKSTGERDETTKRDDFARMGVLEYWRFDESGGQYHSAPLAGDRLVGGVYVPVPIIRQDDGSLRGRSESLGLYLCWEDGELRFWDPVSERYLETYAEVAARANADAARARRLEGELARERQARIEAESRLRNLEDQGP